jgi:hypothetical protein
MSRIAAIKYMENMDCHKLRHKKRAGSAFICYTCPTINATAACIGDIPNRPITLLIIDAIPK